MTLADDLLPSLLDEVEASLEPVRQNVEDQLIQAAPNDTGNLRRAIHVDPFVRSGNTFTALVHVDADYAEYTDTGTGVYAGNGPITPKTARVLSFYWKKLGKQMFLRSVQGMPGTHWFGDQIERYYQQSLDGYFTAAQ